MYQHDAVYLERSDLVQLRSKLIGKGTDGSVYDIGNGYLYKIYHDESYFSNINIQHPLLDGYEDDDVKIAQKGMYSPLKEFYPYFRYVDGDGVRIVGENAIQLAIEKQKYVERTCLPLAPIYVDFRFKGCVLKKHAYHLQLHSLMFLPKELKRKILLSILESIEELLDCNIYHLDIANYSDDRRLSTHSNILVSLFGKPQLIDIDGKSAFYLERENSVLLSKCLRGLNILILKFYYDIDVYDEMLEEDFWMAEQSLQKQKVTDEGIHDLLYRDCDIVTLRKVLTR